MTRWIGVDLDGWRARLYRRWEAVKSPDPMTAMLCSYGMGFLALPVLVLYAWLTAGRFEPVPPMAERVNCTPLDYVCAAKLSTTDDRCVQVQPNAGVPVHEFWRHCQ